MQSYGKYTDEQLIERFKSGDLQAQDYLLKKYKPLVISCKKTYFLSGAGEDDIIQEGMIGLFKAIRDYSPEKGGSFSSFAKLCITRQIITAVKSAGRKKHLPLSNYVSLDNPYAGGESEQPAIGSYAADLQTDPQAVLLGKESKETFSKLIESRLSDLEKTILTAHLNGMSYEEITEQTGKDRKSIDNALQRVKKKLSGAQG